MKAAGATTILDAVNDKNLFAPWFRDHETWAAWFAFIAALFALPMNEDQRAIYEQCSGRSEPPSTAASEAWLICGRRAGKSFVLAMIAVYLACFRDYRQYLSPGERGTVMIIATDRRQARVIFRYVRAYLTMIPMLKRLVVRETEGAFELTNGVTIEISTASFRSVRGYTTVAALLDELAFWPTDDAANPDFEVLAALRPGLVTIPNSMLLCASSPYARRGALWTAHQKHFGKNGDPILCWKAPTRTMNPTVPGRVIDEAMERDPASAAAEYGAQFRSDLESFVSQEVIAACVEVGAHERAPIPGVKYSAFVDPSGGSSDSMTLGIGHVEGDIAVLDAIRERRAPFSPEVATVEFSLLLDRYRIKEVTGDAYAGLYPRELFKKCGVQYNTSDRTKSELYRDFLSALNSHKVALLDNPRLITQLGGLERRTARGGKDSIDHAPGAHDDVANAAAGVLTNLTRTAKSTAGVWGDEIYEPVRRPKIIYVDSMDGSSREPRVVYTTEGTEQ